MLDILGNMKRRTHGITVCPKCGSTAVGRPGVLSGLLLPALFLCDNCGYSGYFIVEVDDHAEAESRSEFKGS